MSVPEAFDISTPEAIFDQVLKLVQSQSELPSNKERLRNMIVAALRRSAAGQHLADDEKFVSDWIGIMAGAMTNGARLATTSLPNVMRDNGLSMARVVQGGNLRH